MCEGGGGIMQEHDKFSIIHWFLITPAPPRASPGVPGQPQLKSSGDIHSAK